MKTIVWLARHGETHWTVEQRFNGRRDQPLSDAGRKQCQRLSSQMATQRLDAIISSPLVRCMETAQILARPHKISVIQEKRLSEMNYGNWEGLTYIEAQALDVSLFKLWENDPATVAPPGGETGEEVAARAIAAFESILNQYWGQQVAIVAHKTVNRILLCTLLDLPISDHRRSISQLPCALSRIEISVKGQILVNIPSGSTEGTLPPIKTVACALPRQSRPVELAFRAGQKSR